MNENLSLTHEELLICERLRSLRMSGMADAFESQMLDPNADLAPFIERFTEIVNHEWQIRYDKKFKRYLKQAHLCRLSSKTATCAILSGQRESYYPAGH